MRAMRISTGRRRASSQSEEIPAFPVWKAFVLQFSRETGTHAGIFSGRVEHLRLFYFGGPHLGAVRLDDFKFQFYQQPFGWPGEKTTTDMPTMVNIRQDPFERTPSIRGETFNNSGGGYTNDFFAREFWRFVLVQQTVAKLAMTAIDYPPMQAPATFNLDAVKAKIQEMVKDHEGQ